MVSFICDACGQTVKKQKVEKHYQSECRDCSVLSCIDCGKDFPGGSYAAHTSCISEAEKYQGKLFKAKDKSNKGERKQQEWIEQVRNASNETGKQDPRIRKLLARITAYDNVPRKETKFKKFCENSINVRDSVLLDKLWEVFSGVKNSNTANSESECKPDETKNIDEEKASEEIDNNNETIEKDNEEKDVCSSFKKEKKEKRRKKKKRKHEEVEEQENGMSEKTDEDKNKKQKKGEKSDVKNEERNTPTNDQLQEDGDVQDVTVVPNEKFNWGSVIKKLLKSAPDNEMSLKKLRKKVINEYVAQDAGDSKQRTEQELRVLFDKKIHKNPKIKVHKERAKLL